MGSEVAKGGELGGIGSGVDGAEADTGAEQGSGFRAMDGFK